MQIVERYRRCAVFLGYSSGKGVRIAATGFAVSYPLPKSGARVNFIVTAKHVIHSIGKTESAHNHEEPVLIRFNLKLQDVRPEAAGSAPVEGLMYASTRLDEWLCHPSDENVDVAVLPRMGPAQREWFPESIFDYNAMPIEVFASSEILDAEQAGPGDDVFIVGMFRNHYGQGTNEIIARVGNIASMPREKVKTGMGDAEMYLIEARSIGGLSGSPVFLHVGGERMRRHPDGDVRPSVGPMMAYFFGLVHGHWDVDAAGVDAAVDDFEGGRINQGIAMVVPARKIREVIEQPSVVARMRQLDEDIMAQQKGEVRDDGQ